MTHVYVVSTGRCGSLSLKKWFANFVPAMMEPLAPAAIALYRLRIQSGKPCTRLAIEKLLSMTSVPHVSVDWSHGTVHALDAQDFLHAPVCVHVDHTMNLCIDDVERVVEESRFVWLIRNGWSCVSSMMAWKWYRDAVDIAPDDIYAANRIQAPWTGEMDEDEWRTLSHLGRSCWYWSWCNRRIEKQLLDHVARDRWIMVRLEDWCDRCALGLCDFLGVEPPQSLSLPRTHAGIWNDLRPTWTDEERVTFNRFCGDEMKRWYPEQEWREP